MCRRSKNLRRRLNRRRLAHHRRWLRRRPTERSAGRCSDRHRHHRCSAKALRPRANPRREAKYLQSHSDPTNRFVRRSIPRLHRTGRWLRPTNHPIRLPSRRRPRCHHLAIRRSCHPTRRRHSGRPRHRRPDCRHLGSWMKRTRRPTSRRRSRRRPSSSSHRSNRRWACCSMNRLKIRRHRWSRLKSPTILPMNRKNRRSACSKASTTRKIAVGGSRPSERRTRSRPAHIGPRASADAWTRVTIQARWPESGWWVDSACPLLPFPKHT
jgi:hypothetical protein